MGGDVIEEQCDDIKLQAPLDVDISIVKKKWRFWGWRAVGSMCAVGAGIVLVAIYSPRLLREKNNKHAVQMIPFDDENRFVVCDAMGLSAVCVCACRGSVWVECKVRVARLSRLYITPSTLLKTAVPMPRVMTS